MSTCIERPRDASQVTSESTYNLRVKRYLAFYALPAPPFFGTVALTFIECKGPTHVPHPYLVGIPYWGCITSFHLRHPPTPASVVECTPNSRHFHHLEACAFLSLSNRTIRKDPATSSLDVPSRIPNPVKTACVWLYHWDCAFQLTQPYVHGQASSNVHGKQSSDKLQVKEHWPKIPPNQRLANKGTTKLEYITEYRIYDLVTKPL